MYTIVIILIIVVCLLLGLVVLIQNPKGGGLNAALGGVSNQVFGAKKSTDIVEKTTWYLAFTIFLLCLASVYVSNIDTTEDVNKGVIEKIINE